jgi:hypothetical protein
LGLRFWHTKETHRLLTSAVFSRAATTLLDVIWAFKEAPIVGYSVTVLLEDYRRAKAVIPDLRSPEALCVLGCVGNLVIPNLADLPVLLYFDRGEKFMKEIEPVWIARKKRFAQACTRDWSGQIKSIQIDDFEASRPLQAADLLAWGVRRHQQIRRQPNAPISERQLAVSMALRGALNVPHLSAVFDYDRIMSVERLRAERDG